MNSSPRQTLWYSDRRTFVNWSNFKILFVSNVWFLFILLNAVYKRHRFLPEFNPQSNSSKLYHKNIECKTLSRLCNRSGRFGLFIHRNKISAIAYAILWSILYGPQYATCCMAILDGTWRPMVHIVCVSCRARIWNNLNWGRHCTWTSLRPITLAWTREVQDKNNLFFDDKIRSTFSM